METRTIKLPDKKAMRRLIEDAERRAKSARSVHRQYIAINTWTWLAYLQGQIPLDLKFYSDLYDTNRHEAARYLAPAWEAGIQNFMNTTGYDYDRACRDVLHNEAQLIFITIRSVQMSDVPNWFIPGEDLIYSLLATDLDGIYPDDVKLPAPGFFIELPRGIMVSKSDRGMHDVLSIGVSECFVDGKDVTMRGSSFGNRAMRRTGEVAEAVLGRRLSLSLIREPLHDDDCGIEDCSTFGFTIPLNKPDKTLKESIAIEDDLGWIVSNNSEEVWGSICGVEYGKVEFRNIITSFLTNILIYMTSENATKKTKQARKRKAKKGSSVKTALQSNDIFLGNDVIIDPGVKAAVISGKKRMSKLAKTFRRGHFFNQAYGPRHTLRRRWWRKPCVVNLDAEGAITGHRYKEK